MRIFTWMRQTLQSSSVLSCLREAFNISEISNWKRHKSGRMTSELWTWGSWQTSHDNLFYSRFLERIIHSGKQEDILSVDQKSGEKNHENRIQMGLDQRRKTNLKVLRRGQLPKGRQRQGRAHQEGRKGGPAPLTGLLSKLPRKSHQVCGILPLLPSFHPPIHFPYLDRSSWFKQQTTELSVLWDEQQAHIPEQRSSLLPWTTQNPCKKEKLSCLSVWLSR